MKSPSKRKASRVKTSKPKSVRPRSSENTDLKLIGEGSFVPSGLLNDHDNLVTEQLCTKPVGELAVDRLARDVLLDGTSPRLTGTPCELLAGVWKEPPEPQ
jgi:hypothetical protein